MTSKKEIEIRKAGSPTNTILIGALVGAGAGVIAALLIHRRAKKQERETMITASEAIQLGLLVFGLFRAISALGDDEK
jgi:gas vesicle protein